MTTRWFPDEWAYAGAEHLDADFVAGYDRKQGAVADRDAAEAIEVLTGHGVGPGSTVVDLGAGTGRFALAAARRVQRVIAVDVSPGMVDHLRRAVADAGADNVECVQAGLLTFEPAGDAVDAVYTRNVLHQLPDFWKAIALRRIAGLLRPGGVLRLHDLVYDVDPGDAEEAIASWLDGAAPRPEDGYTADELAAHVRDEHSTFTWLLRPMLERAGFEIVDERVRRSVYATYTCLRR